MRKIYDIANTVSVRVSATERLRASTLQLSSPYLHLSPTSAPFVAQLLGSSMGKLSGSSYNNIQHRSLAVNTSWQRDKGTAERAMNTRIWWV